MHLKNNILCNLFLAFYLCIFVFVQPWLFLYTHFLLLFKKIDSRNLQPDLKKINAKESRQDKLFIIGFLYADRLPPSEIQSENLSTFEYKNV